MGEQVRGFRAVDRGSWRRRLIAAGLEASLAALLAEYVRPGIALTTGASTTDEALPIGCSKVGGRPDLPPAMAWPTRRPYRLLVPCRGRPRMNEEAPLAFLAQLSLADVAASGGIDLALPDRGLLSFFYDAESQPRGFDPGDWAGWRLMWFSDAMLQRQQWPENLAHRFAAVPLMLRARECVPPPQSLAVTQIPNPGVDRRFSREQLESLFRDAKTRDELVVSTHALGGWPCPIQSEMETQCQLMTNGIFCGGPEGFSGARAARLRAGAADWRLLLQLDTDARAGWTWGDGGKVYVWMREQDVRACRFDRCWTILQSH